MSIGASLSTARSIGRYRLGGELAAGGMATVHIGKLETQLGFSRVVAIKQLHPQYAKDRTFVSMLLDEGRLASRVRHRNVVPVLDVVADERELFLVMEYVPGESLSNLVRTLGAGERVPLPVALAIMIDALHGLHAAHQATDERGTPLGIVHRDVSPQNILVGTDGVARLLDFGIAKATGRMQTTRSDELKGKLAYMAPEQLARVAVDCRTDVFAASVVLWELCTGARLFAADDEVSTLARVAQLAIPTVRSVRPEISEALSDLVARGLSRDPALRFPCASSMALALEGLNASASASEVARFVARHDTPTVIRGRLLIEAAEHAAAKGPAALETPLASPSFQHLGPDHPLRDAAQRVQVSEAPTRVTREVAVVQQAASPHPRTATRRWLAGLFTLCLLAWAGLSLWPGASNPLRHSAPAPLSSPPVATLAEAPPAPREEQRVEPPAPLNVLPSTPPPTRVPESRPVKRASTRDRRVTHKASDECRVPFTLDASGVRIPKRHCL